MGRAVGTVAKDATTVNMVPVGGIAQVFRSGDAYKAVGEIVSRAAYPALSAAFPLAGSLDTQVISPNTNFTPSGYAYGAGIIVGVGYGSGVATTVTLSYDGREWFTVPVAGGYWNCIAYGAGVFCALTTDGKVMTSPDGITWTARANLAAGTWNGITFGGGKFVAVQGNNSAVAASSTDGITFTPRTLPTASNWVDVIYAGGQYLAVASSSNAGATSPDGVTWTARAMPSASGIVGRIAYGAGRYVVTATSGQIYSSADGITWTTYVSGVGSFQFAVFGNGVFIAFSQASSGVAFTSYDGINWKRRTLMATGISGAVNGSYFAGVFSILTVTASIALFAENITDSDYLYLRGTAGQFVRVK